MNLISETWIPVRRADGSLDKIAPWQITDHIGTDKSPIVAIATPRPDFDGALVQFLIGLLQTTCTPPDKMTWRKWRKEPPSIDELKARFEAMAFAFELEGDGPRFMQDMTLGPADFLKKSKKSKKNAAVDAEDQEEGQTPIANLLIEAPGKITKDENRDHFVKRDFVKKLCPHCAAAALFSLQTNSPGRGAGYRTSLRGGGPLTTIILSEDTPDEQPTLWATCWLNMLDEQTYLSGKSGNPDKNQEHDRFPWLAPTRISENDRITTPDDIHPDQQYWAMPQRIRLIENHDGTPDTCDMCGNSQDNVYRYYYVKKFGVNYKGAFRHPLSPYDLIGEQPRAVLTEPGGVGYRHWLGIVENEPNSTRQRASAVERFINLNQGPNARDARLWAFGFDIYNSNKVRGWTDATLPVFQMPEEVRELFIPIVKNMTVTANRVCGLVLSAVFRANFLEPKGKKTKKGKAGFDVIWVCPKPLKKFNKPEEKMEATVLNEQRALLFSARVDFWDRTEGIFLETMKRVKDILSIGQTEKAALEDWLRRLKRESLRCSENYVQAGDFDSSKPRKLALAQYELERNLNNPFLRNLLKLT